MVVVLVVVLDPFMPRNVAPKIIVRNQAGNRGAPAADLRAVDRIAIVKC